MARDKSSKRRNDILMAALACFTEHGIQGATIDMIRERSGASVGSLYHHFGNKEKIVAALYIEGMRDHQMRLMAALENAEDAESGIRTIVSTFVHWIAENPDWARFVFYARSQVAVLADDPVLQNENRHFWEALQRWFRRHVEGGNIRQLPKDCYSSLIIGPAQDYARRWLSGRASTSLVEHVDIFADAAWRVVSRA